MNRRAFVMIEMFCVLGLLAVVGLLSVRVLAVSIRSAHDASETEERIGRYEAALAQLRSDTLRAEQPAVGDGNGLRFGAVRWTSDADGVSRQEGNTLQKWVGVRIGLKPSSIGIDVWPVEDPRQVISLPIPQQWLVKVIP